MPIFIVSPRKNKTIERLESISDGDIINHENIIPWDDIVNELIDKLNMPRAYDPSRDRKYSIARGIVNKYEKIDGVSKAQKLIRESPLYFDSQSYDNVL